MKQFNYKVLKTSKYRNSKKCKLVALIFCSTKSSQNDSLIQQMKDEFDELAILYQASRKEVEGLNSRSKSEFQTLDSEANSLAFHERNTLNKLIASLENARTQLENELSICSKKLKVSSKTEEELDDLKLRLKRTEMLLYESKDVGNAALSRLEAQGRSFDEDFQQVHSQLQEAERVISNLQIDLRQALQNLLAAEERIRAAEIDRDQLLHDHSRIRDQFDMDLLLEQQRFQETLEYRLSEIRSSYTSTLGGKHFDREILTILQELFRKLLGYDGFVQNGQIFIPGYCSITHIKVLKKLVIDW
jgi:hypothetical protein